MKIRFLTLFVCLSINIFSQILNNDTIVIPNIELSGSVSSGIHFYSSTPSYSNVGTYNTFLVGNLNIDNSLLPFNVSFDLNFSENYNGNFNKFKINFDRAKFQDNLRSQLMDKTKSIENNMQDIEEVNKLVGLKNTAIYDSYPKSYKILNDTYKIKNDLDYNNTKKELSQSIKEINQILNKEEVKINSNKLEVYKQNEFIIKKDEQYQLNINEEDTLYEEVKKTLDIMYEVIEYEEKKNQYKKIKKNYKKLEKDKKGIESMQQSSYSTIFNKNEYVMKGLATFDMLDKKTKILNSVKDFQLITVNKKLSELTLNNIQLLGAAATIEYEKFFHFSLVSGIDKSAYGSFNHLNVLRRDNSTQKKSRVIHGIRGGVGSESGDFLHFIYLSGKDKLNKNMIENSFFTPKKNNILSGVAQKTFLKEQIKIGGEFSYSVTTYNTQLNSEYIDSDNSPILFKKNTNSSTVDDYAFNFFSSFNLKKSIFRMKYIYRGNDYFSMGNYYSISGNEISIDFNQKIIPNKVELNISYLKQFNIEKILNQKRNYDNIQTNVLMKSKKEFSFLINYSFQNSSFQTITSQGGEDTLISLALTRNTLFHNIGLTINKTFNLEKLVMTHVLGAQVGGDFKNNTYKLYSGFYTLSILSNKGFSLTPSITYQQYQYKENYTSSLQAQLPMEYRWKSGYTLGGGVGITHSSLNGKGYFFNIKSRIKLYKTLFLNAELGIQNNGIRVVANEKKYIISGLVSLQYQFRNLKKQQ